MLSGVGLLKSYQGVHSDWGVSYSFKEATSIEQINIFTTKGHYQTSLNGSIVELYLDNQLKYTQEVNVKKGDTVIQINTSKPVEADRIQCVFKNGTYSGVGTRHLHFKNLNS